MNHRKGCVSNCLLVLFSCLIFSPLLHAQNQVLGEVELIGASKVENTSGVWVDGQYVGYVSELKGSKKLLLLPGDHNVTIRQAGYEDFGQEITVRAGEKQTINITMKQDMRVNFPKVTAEIKLEVKPNRAAVFVDGVFIGHIAEFEGVGKALLVAPGKRKIKITLPGYHTFETEVDLLANQKTVIKTEMVAGGPAEGTPLSQ
jgi:hypothetical protein